MKFVLAAAFMAFAVLQIGAFADPVLDPKPDLTNGNLLAYKSLEAITTCHLRMGKFPVSEFQILEQPYYPLTDIETSFVICFLGEDGLNYYNAGNINADNIRSQPREFIDEQTVTDAIKYCVPSITRFISDEPTVAMLRCFQFIGLIPEYGK